MRDSLSKKRARLQVEQLEARVQPSIDAPPAPWLTQSFDANDSAGLLPLNWSRYSSDNGTTAFAVAASQPLSGSNSLAATSGTGGASSAVARAWLNTEYGPDIEVGAAVYLSAVQPAQVLLRGSKLDSSGASYYALSISRTNPGPTITISRVVNGTDTVVATLTPPPGNYLSGQWVRLTLRAIGNSLQAEVYRHDTSQYMTASGGWQAAQTYALTATDTDPAAILGGGQAGVGRPAGYAGSASNLNFDDFSVLQLPATGGAEDFDGATGALPGGWATPYSSDPNTTVSVTATADATSAPNGLTFTSGTGALSNAVARAWLSTAQPADGQFSVDVALNSVWSQLIARGQNLNSSSAAFYALSIQRDSPGPRVKLSRWSGSTETVLDSLGPLSTYFATGSKFRLTLNLSGNQLQAQVYRYDTNEYLNSAGGGQAAATYALTATDTSPGAITTAGNVGVGRGASYTGTVTFDNFTTPGGATPVAVPFEGMTANQPPTGFSVWSSTGVTTNTYTVKTTADAGIASLSGNRLLGTTAPTSSASTRAWYDSAQFADASVSTGFYATNATVPPVRLIARGQNLNLATPTYYGLVYTNTSSPGGTLRLVKVVNGVETTLSGPGGPATLNVFYQSARWVQLTLFVSGNSIRAQLYRITDQNIADAEARGQNARGQYLNENGQWQTLPCWAINTTDTSITGAGFAGIGRDAGTTGNAYFDNFTVLPLPTTAGLPTVTITAPASTGTITGTTTVTTSVSPGVQRAEFYVDGRRYAMVTGGAFNWTFDTATVDLGSGGVSQAHTLLVKVYDANGSVAWDSRTITTQNNTTVTPSILNPNPADPDVVDPHYDHVRIVQLAYSGGGGIDYTLLDESTDVVVVTDSAKQQLIATNYPEVAQIAYTNASNLYNDLLTDWLTYADGMDAQHREEAFYHVAFATPFSANFAIGNNSTRDVRTFWQAYRGAGTLTKLHVTNAGLTTGVSFGAPGSGSTAQSLYVGYPDRFREININLTTPADASYTYVLEYCSAVDANGMPLASGWKTLTIISDTTNSLRHAGLGRITFDPPSDWVPAKLESGEGRVFFVRFRATSSTGTTPVASVIQGRNYLQSTGSNQNLIIPAFDYDADLNGDGYLNDAEYSASGRDAGKTARFVYETRWLSYGQFRFHVNPSNPDFANWVLSSYPADFAVGGKWQYSGGLFMDNSTGNAPAVAGDVLETVDSFSYDYGRLLNRLVFAIRAVKPDAWILPNIAGGKPGSMDPIVKAVGTYWDEKVLRAMQFDTNSFNTYVSRYNSLSLMHAPGQQLYAMVDASATGYSPPVGSAEEDPRVQMATLAAYYMFADPGYSFLNFFGGDDPSSAWKATDGQF
jgi:hypothetical protein